MFGNEIATLSKFTEKANYLNSLSLVKTLSEGNSQLEISWREDTGVLSLIQKGPNSEQIDAFILTMRLFMQNNDAISIRNTAKLIDSLPISQSLKEEFRDLRNNLNNYLDSDSVICVNDDRPTKREVLDNILYGKLAHLKPEKQARCEKWFAVPMAAQIINHEFVGILSSFLQGVQAFSGITQEVLIELESKPGEIYGKNEQRRWYHGSPAKLASLRAGSSVTPFPVLGKAYSHKPQHLVITFSENTDSGISLVHIEQDGEKPGFLYEVDVSTSEPELMIPEENIGPLGEEMVTTKELRLILVEAVAVSNRYEFELSVN